MFLKDRKKEAITMLHKQVTKQTKNIVFGSLND